jgi:hypothetical protein
MPFRPDFPLNEWTQCLLNKTLAERIAPMDAAAYIDVRPDDAS